MEGSNEEHDKQEKESSNLIELVLKAERLLVTSTCYIYKS